MIVDGHGVAIAAVWSADDSWLHVQCECGWHQSFGQVTTAEAVRQAVDEHLTAAVSEKARKG